MTGDNSSLPEGGGPFAVYVDAGSPQAMATAIAPLTRDPALLAAREEMIRRRFRPHDWAAIAGAMLAIARAALL